MHEFGTRIRRFDGVAVELMTPSMMIGGQLIEVPGSRDVFNPATEELIGKCPECEKEELEEAVKAAKEAFIEWSATSFEVRKKLVLRLADVLEQNRAKLAEILILEQGKPRARALGEVSSAVNYCRAFCDMMMPFEVLEETVDRRVELRRKPIGVVAAITPWNYPILLAFWKISPALIAGNCVILKPSPYAPLAILSLGEVIRDIFPAGVLNM